MENCCFNCKNFRIWDEDPCCLEKDEWKIVLPSMICDKHELETFGPVLRLHSEMWDECKEEFFKKYKIEKEDLIQRHLQLFPKDKELINMGG